MLDEDGNEITTTIQDLPVAEDGAIIGNSGDDRLAAMQSINDTNDVERAAELANINDDETTEPFIPGGNIDEVEEDPPAVPLVADTAAPARTKVIINGREMEFTQEELIARAAKVESADQYLEDAKRRAAPAAPIKETPSGPSAEDVERERLEQRRALVRAIQIGTEEEAMQAIEHLMPRAPQLNVDALAKTVDERLEFNAAIKTFNKDYADITKDQYLNKMALDLDDDLVRRGDIRPYGERYAAIGEHLRAWVKSKTGSQGTAPSMVEKQAHKSASAPAVKSANVKAPAPKSDEDAGPEKPSNVIDAMRASRGGPQWMRGPTTKQ